MTHPDQARRRAYYWGLVAEWLAIGFYLCQGYRLVAWRLKTPAGEVDAVLRRGKWLVAVEVKARARPSLHDAVTKRQLMRVGKGLAWLRSRRKHFQRCICRVDVLILSHRRWPVWVRHAWEDER